MPRFLHPDAPALNSYLSAKARVVKRNRKKYENWDSAYQKELASLGQAQQGASVIFDNLLTILTNLDAAALEIKSTLQLAGTTGGRIGFADRYLASNSSMIKLVTSLQQQMQKLNYSFNIFSEPQIKDLLSKYTSVVNLIAESEQLIEIYRRRRNSEWIGQAWEQLTQNSWLQAWNDVSAKIDGGLKGYKYSLTATSSDEPILATSGAGRRTRSCRIIGGQGPAGREPFQFTTFASNLGTYPPRNTQDLIHLPRRFL